MSDTEGRGSDGGTSSGTYPREAGGPGAVRLAGPHLPGLHRTGALIAALSALALVLFAADLAFGSVRIPPGEVLRALAGRSGNAAWNSIVLIFRLPKALTALGAGAALAVAGLLLQTMFRNPLAGPDTLGIGSGASVGVALVVLASGAAGGQSLLAGLGLAGYAAISAAASLGAFLVLLLIVLLARRLEHGVTLLIVGLLVGYLASSLVSLLVYFGSPQRVQSFLGWTYGSFSGVTARQLPVLGGTLALGFGLTAHSSKELNALLLGESFATGLGIGVRSARTRILVAASILSGAVTAFCGPIAFLGIAAPQAARRLLKTSDHALLVPGSALVGIVFALAADIAAQSPGGGAVLPLNPLLALIGAPIILGMFLRGARGEGRST
jgi:iron complex transport system permease protein